MRTSKIRWGSEEEVTLRKAVRAFNEKIRRIEKKGGEEAQYAPKRKSIAAERAKAQEGTRKEFQRQVKETRAFSEKGAEKVIRNQLGTVVTKWEMQKAKELVRRENIVRARRRKEISTDVKKGLAIPEEIQAQKAKKVDFQRKTPEEWKRFVGALEERLAEKYKSAGFEKYKENYLKSLRNTLGMYGEILAQRLKGWDAKKLYQFTKNNADAQIDFIYGFEEAADKFDRLSEVFGFDEMGEAKEGEDE